MQPDKVSKSYIRQDNTAVITCPHCGRQKTINTESFKQHKSRLKIKCACENMFTVDLEFRKRVRKPVSLKGTYTNHSQNNSKGDIRVRNISVSGLEFSTLDINNFKEGDELTLSFNLDDEHRTEISKEATVVAVRTATIGCEFAGTGNIAFDGPLGLYVMS